jgi:tRNA nucleotidyltransferase/poly(A) polymerase
VGDPLQRFAEDGLRPLRACRFASQLGFELDPATLAAIPQRLGVAAKVSVERVFTELDKLLKGEDPARGLGLLEQCGLLDLWLPELRPMIGCGQNRHHRHDVWVHTLGVVEGVPPTSALRWAALLHDAGKPACRTLGADGQVHFYGHEVASLNLVGALLKRLKASHALQAEVAALVRHHGTHPAEDWGDGACRRFLKKLSDDGLPLSTWGTFRRADQQAKGVEVDTRIVEHQGILARLEALAAATPPLSVKSLALDGRELQQLAGRPGGPWLGELQKQLLEAVLEDPAQNTPERLELLSRKMLS